MKLNKIKLIVYDFDGVMTNNKAYIDMNGNEFVQISRADGLGVSEIKKQSINQIILSSEKNKVVQSRAKKLGIECIHGVDDKKDVLIKYCTNNKIDINSVAYVGNDINDEEVMKIVGYTFCPSDSHKRIKKIAQHVLISKGGDGVAREILDLIS